MVFKVEPFQSLTQNLSHDQSAASWRTYQKPADDVWVHQIPSQKFHGATVLD
jgi:hypothetical protein